MPAEANSHWRVSFRIALVLPLEKSQKVHTLSCPRIFHYETSDLGTQCFDSLREFDPIFSCLTLEMLFLCCLVGTPAVFLCLSDRTMADCAAQDVKQGGFYAKVPDFLWLRRERVTWRPHFLCCPFKLMNVATA